MQVLFRSLDRFRMVIHDHDASSRTFVITMNLGNAFARRKQLSAEINTWINRLGLAGRNTKQYQTLDISGGKDFSPIPGTIKQFTRNYSIEECRERLDKLIAEDRDLALRISLTNQIAKGKVVNMDGEEQELTIPELLVLKNDIAPKIEQAIRNIPRKATGIELMEQKEKSVKWRTISTRYKTEQVLGDKGVAENKVVDYHDVHEVEDFGYSERAVFDEVDKVHKWMQSLKEAVNQANQTELVDL